MSTKSETLTAIREAYESGPLAAAQELAAQAVRDRALTTTDYVWLVKWTEGRASWSDVDTSVRPSASEPMGPVA